MNRNTAHAEIFVNALVEAGLKHIVLVPGSRHTALVLAFAKHPALTVHSHLDERSAAFYALGLAMATGQPTAITCTSGSAGANMFPAIVEAHQSRVPLIVITADRPPELRHSGANQTMDQLKLFGDFALWAVDVALPEAAPPAVAVRNLRTLAHRAYAVARKGVVHVNMPFRKPLEPTPVPGDVLPDIPPRPLKITPADAPTPSAQAVAELSAIIAEHDNGVIIAGGNAQPVDAIRTLSAKTGYPVLAECRSRFGSGGLGAYEFYADRLPAPDVIIRVGDVPISKALNMFIVQAKAPHMIHLSADGIWADDSHLVTVMIHAAPRRLADALSVIERTPSTHYTQFERRAWDVVEAELTDGVYFDAGVVYDVVDLLPDESALFAGNSLPIRHVDQFAKPTADRRLNVFANRGVSGIDGNISTALGIGAGRPSKPLVAVIGDITFYHDMNGLLAVRRCGVPVTIVLLNNDGGGIFHRLPIREHDPAFTDYFITSHGLDYAHAAQLYGLDYVHINAQKPDARAMFRTAFADAINTPGQSTIIEVRTDAECDLMRLKSIYEGIGGIVS